MSEAERTETPAAPEAKSRALTAPAQASEAAWQVCCALPQTHLPDCSRWLRVHPEAPPAEVGVCELPGLPGKQEALHAPSAGDCERRFTRAVLARGRTESLSGRDLLPL